MLPAEMLLQSEDVGTGVVVENEYTLVAGEEATTWFMNLDGCPSYAGLHVTAWQRYTFLRGRNLVVGPVGEPGDTVFASVARYPLASARQFVTDVNRVAAACPVVVSPGGEASTPQKPMHTRHTWSVIGQGFAGDQSVLVRHKVYDVVDATGATTLYDTSIIAVVRVGDVVAVLERYLDDPAALKSLAIKAATRICTGPAAAC
jgi:hypothetical protein